MLATTRDSQAPRAVHLADVVCWRRPIASTTRRAEAQPRPRPCCLARQAALPATARREALLCEECGSRPARAASHCDGSSKRNAALVATAWMLARAHTIRAIAAGCRYRPHPSVRGLGAARVLSLSRMLGPRYCNATFSITRMKSTARPHPRLATSTPGLLLCDAARLGEVRREERMKRRDRSRDRSRRESPSLSADVVCRLRVRDSNLRGWPPWSSSPQ